ncbi:type IV toxin-antitoxin system AbiEi family antitoxin domain-containing protein [Enorma burkinafasonensis]|uniref:type IV toxin-antitoxin system AbiEi family antitoxin domain-containing protein n=1 Tax=Enorma burkinafasonensis TaxID=2590867 RepID=UPI0026F0C684|nr:type IV toxin-antitoxin system AbiEi family antitoxin domain-containing protein [Enorma burkinafasonensis]MCI7729864.1 type IV toxin-antitoxin system AbiEi family antitoxin domain-containing protein [Enorma burkinafasonensis]
MLDLAGIAGKQNGYVTSSQVTSLGIPRRLLTDAVESGELVQIARGLYALPDTWEDELFITQHRFARGVFSDETALYLHGLTDRAPFSLTMTFPRSYNTTAARKAGVICRTCADDLLDLGMREMVTQYGNPVRAYDAERALCDIVRGQAVVDSQVVVPAMRAYAASRDRDVVKLMEYARKLGVEAKVRGYMEVLL